MAFDPTTLLNFIFALIIVILGYWVFKAKKLTLAVYIAITFALFAVSHLAVLLGVPGSDISIIVIRSLAYLVVIYGLIREVRR